jgi:hypothetical protein
MEQVNKGKKATQSHKIRNKIVKEWTMNKPEQLLRQKLMNTLEQCVIKPTVIGV